MKTNDTQFLEICDHFAAQAREAGESAVGSVVVIDGQVISTGVEATKAKNDVTAHAEIEAVKNAVAKIGANALRGATLYSSHEPCIMCSYVIRHYKLARIVFRNAVPDVGGSSSPWPVLTTIVPGKWPETPEVVHYSKQ
jgi:tRNA(adenine34) deaminase